MHTVKFLYKNCLIFLHKSVYILKILNTTIYKSIIYKYGTKIDFKFKALDGTGLEREMKLK